MLPLGNQKGCGEARKKDVLRGALALMVLKTLDLMGPLHGYGIARRIEQISGDLLIGNKHLRAETREWEQTASIIARFFKVTAEELL